MKCEDLVGSSVYLMRMANLVIEEIKVFRSNAKLIYVFFAQDLASLSRASLG